MLKHELSYTGEQEAIQPAPEKHKKAWGLRSEKVMEEACTCLKNIIEVEKPEKIEHDKNGNKIANVAVTVDGTWQKRGHSS